VACAPSSNYFWVSDPFKSRFFEDAVSTFNFITVSVAVIFIEISDEQMVNERLRTRAAFADLVLFLKLDDCPVNLAD